MIVKNPFLELQLTSAIQNFLLTNERTLHGVIDGIIHDYPDATEVTPKMITETGQWLKEVVEDATSRCDCELSLFYDLLNISLDYINWCTISRHILTSYIYGEIKDK